MGCTRPIEIPNKNYNGGTNLRDGEHQRFYKVPCGTCINCRTERRNNLETMLKLELQNYKGMACFGTLTYTDEYLIQNGRTVYDEVKNIPYTASKRDFQLFMKRLRINLERKGYKQKLKYVFCTEYGDVGHRCHMHFVILGINGNCLPEIQKSWRAKYTINGVTKKYPIGRVDCADLKTGGLRYVIKYMDYAPIGTEQKRIWIENGLEPPVIKHSGGLGVTNIVEQIKNGTLQNGYFRTGEGDKTKRLSRYYLNKYGIMTHGEGKVIETYENMLNNGWNVKGLGTIDNLRKREEYLHQKSLLEENDKLTKLKQQGIDISSYEKNIE